MPSLCLYFQVHQPQRLKPYRYFDNGVENYFDHQQNQAIMQKVAVKCYLPTNQILFDLIQEFEGRFKIAFSISGTAIEQFQRFCPEVMDSFRTLVDTGCVELLNETYHHSLSSVFSEHMFQREVLQHRCLLQTEFNYIASTFRNTELIFNNHVANMVARLGYQTILAEGADKILGLRNANYLYQTASTPPLNLLLKNYALSDDIAFRFSNSGWSEYPLTADKYVQWIKQALEEAELINLFMDYETFGEHQWQCTGIFEFLQDFPRKMFTRTDCDFCLPKEVSERYASRETLDIPDFYSWADEARDLSAWIGNAMQRDALERVYALEERVLKLNNPKLSAIWGSLLTSDHFYYMCTKHAADGEVHQYFSPYESPYEAYINYQTILKDFTQRLEYAE